MNSRGSTTAARALRPAPAVQADSDNDVLVAMSGVSKTYSGSPTVTALHPSDLTVGRGDYVAIMGPSGSGKSTLLNLLGLIDEPSSGEYLLDGQPTASLSERARSNLRAYHIGFVFQSFHLVSYRTAVENVAAGLLYQHVRAAERTRRAVDELDRVGLSHRLRATPNEMSGGECQRVALARALVRRPSLVLCDEPTGNLDTATGAQVMDLIDALHAAGQTIVVITHDAAVGRRAERRIEIRDGVIVPDQQRRPASR